MTIRPRPRLIVPAPIVSPGPAPLQFISSGSRLLDLVLGGGWAVGRIANIVGDKSSGKTALAVEACVNFGLCVPLSHLHYVEAESAFDEQYAKILGMPDGLHPTADIDTVEQWFVELEKFLAKHATSKQPKLSVIDSLDALTDAAELERDLTDPTYGGSKAKQFSQMLRRKVRALDAANCTLMVISQVRDNIGVMFGEKSKRSGGRALDFYASQTIWLAETGKITRTIHNAKRVIGITVRARAKKIKVGMPFRECEMVFLFNYGIDDEISMLDYIKTNKFCGIGEAEYKRLDKAIDAAREARDRLAVKQISDTLYGIVRDHWMMIEAELQPKMRKYES